jgi:hypothetical protein
METGEPVAGLNNHIAAFWLACFRNRCLFRSSTCHDAGAFSATSEAKGDTSASKKGVCR